MALSISVLNGFFLFMFQEEVVEKNPMIRITRPRIPKQRNTTRVGESEVKQMFDACEDWQELICISVLCYLGPRRTAAANLRWQDINFTERNMRFFEKGNKVVWKPVPDDLLAILKAAQESSEVPSDPEDWVIPNRRPKSMRSPKGQRSNKLIYETVKRVADRAGVVSNVHALRAAFAVRYLETHPGDLEALQELMGHEDLTTTRVYLDMLNRSRAMKRVRDLSWTTNVFPPSSGEAHTGFEPVLPHFSLYEPVRQKLLQLGAVINTPIRG